MSEKKRKRAEPTLPGSCVLCKTIESDEFRLGKFYKTQNISAHYFCVLFACGLAQNGRSSREGIEGFLVKDIINEINRGSRLRCCYCGLTGATVGCNLKKCPRSFHLPCGLDNGALNQFFGVFCTFCEDHKPKQIIPKELLKNDILCTICYSGINVTDKDSFLKASCCASNWFHRKCIQLYASSAGYFFKCPLCNDKKDFKKEMLQYGIHIPKQDASWEKERNAFHELLVRAKCDAEECLCPKGRQENNDDSVWRLVYCEDCGSTARHVKCENLSRKKIWKCNDCIEFNKKLIIKRKKEKQNPNQPGSSLGNSTLGNMNPALQELLKQCKRCSVKLDVLQLSDLPKNLQTKYKNQLKPLENSTLQNKFSSDKMKNESKLSIKSEACRSLFPDASIERNICQPSCSKQKNNTNIKNNRIKKQIVHRSHRFSSPMKFASDSSILPFNSENKVLEFSQQKVKQTFIESFFGNKAEKLYMDNDINDETPFFKNASYLQTDFKTEKNDQCLLQHVSNTSIDSVLNCSFGNQNFTILRRKHKTTNLYLKGISSSMCNDDRFQRLAKSLQHLNLSPFQNINPQNNISTSSSELALTERSEDCRNKTNEPKSRALKSPKSKAINKSPNKISSSVKRQKLSSVYDRLHLTMTPRKLRGSMKKKNHSRLSKMTNVYLDPEHISGIYISHELMKKGVLSTLNINLGNRCDTLYKINTFGSCAFTTNRKSELQLQKGINNSSLNPNHIVNQQCQSQTSILPRNFGNAKSWKVVTLDEMLRDKPPILPKMDTLPSNDPKIVVSNKPIVMPTLEQNSVLPTPIVRFCSEKVTIVNPLNATECRQLEKKSVIIPPLYNSSSIFKKLCTSNQINNNAVENFRKLNSSFRTNPSIVKTAGNNFSLANMFKKNGKVVSTILPSPFTKNLYSSVIPRNVISSEASHAYERIASIKKEIEDTVFDSNNLPTIAQRKIDCTKKMNACVDKYLNKADSVSTPDTSNEKRKKRLKLKSDQSEKKYQNNTILSYFFTI